MAGKLSFSIAINLLTENFKKGTSTVKNAFNSMQAQILTFAAAMGFAGVGLSNFFSQLIQVARETSKAVTALKNVSGSTAQFASNLQFTTGLAKKYGAYVNDLTANFAKFSVAASISGMAMEDQRKLFESLSRAAAGFGMSADESNGMFLAVTQMMGKGKIQAEELRGQLGERLPIAMQAMAKAAGTTVAGLDKLMKAGKLLSADVLPKFADAINEMLPNVNTDNIETSLNNLKNAFQEFTQNTGIQDAYKKLIDGLTSFVNYAKDKMSTLATFIISLVSGKILANVFSFFREQVNVLNSTVKKHEVAEAQKQLATQKRIDAEKLLEAVKTDYETKENGKRLASKAQLKKAESALDIAKLSEKKAVLAEQTAAENAAAVKSMGFWKKTGAVVVSAGKRAAMALKAVWSTVGPMVLVTVISAVVAKLVNMYTEAKRIKNIFNDYQKDESQNKSVEEINRIKVLKAIVDDTNILLDKRKTALDELNSLLGTSYSIDDKNLTVNEDINKVIEKRIELLKASAKAQFYAARQIETEDKVESIYTKYGGKRGYDQAVLNDSERQGSSSGNDAGIYAHKTYYKTPRVLQNDINEISQYKKVLGDIDDKIKGAVVDSISSNPVIPASDPDGKKSPLQKAEESYAKKLRELEARREIENISLSDYNKSLDDLNKSSLIEAKASGDKQILESKYYEGLKQKVQNLNYTDEQKALDAFLEVEKSYNEEKNKLKNQLENGVIKQEKYNEELASLSETTAKTAGSLSGIGEAGEQFIQTLQETAANARVYTVPELGKRDTTFDYKKTDIEKKQEERDTQKSNVDKLKSSLGSDADKIEEKLKASKGNLEALKAEYGKNAEDLIVALNDALNNVTSLDEALKIAQVKQDIKDLSNELNEGLYSGVKDVVSYADRLVSSVENLCDVFNNVDSTEWEKIMAVWNAMINAVDGFISIIKTIETLTAITEELASAKNAEKKIVGEAADVTAAAAGQAAKGAIALKEIATSKTVTATYKAEMAAKTAAAYAGIPFAGAGIAAAQIVAMNALIAASAIPGFNNGGIITYGSTSGDKTLARVNKGEMILNGSQQATLFQLANSKGGVGRDVHVTGEVIVTGDKMQILLDNNAKKKRRGR